jgi:cell division protein FtsW (lipid II flippase)
MLETISNYLQKWNTTKTEREKLQGVYFVLGSGIVLLSGLMTFINASLGYSLVTIGLIFLAAFVMNGVAWHLLSSIFLSRFTTRSKKK